jgi:hypothetical protein
MPHYCAAVNCYNLSNKVRLSLFRFPEEADRYSNVSMLKYRIFPYKNTFCHRISMLFSSSDMTSSVNGAIASIVVLSIKRCPAVPIGALGLQFTNCKLVFLTTRYYFLIMFPSSCSCSCMNGSA